MEVPPPPPIPREQCFHYKSEAAAQGQWSRKSMVDGPPDIQPEELLRALEPKLGELGLDPDTTSVNPLITASTASYAYEVTDAAGSLFCLRVQPHSPAYVSYFPAELLARHSARQAGLETPAILATHQDARPAIEGVAFSLEEHRGTGGIEWLAAHGRDADKLIEFVAGQLVLLHGVRLNAGYGFFDAAAAQEGRLVGLHSDYRPHLLASLDPLLEMIVAADEMRPTQASELRSFYHTDPLIEKLASQPQVLLHGDAGPHNVLVGADGQPSALTDFEETKSGPRLYDLAVARWVMQECMSATIGKWSNLVEAYAAAGGQLPKDHERLLATLTMRLEISHMGAALNVLGRTKSEAVFESVRRQFRRGKYRLMQNAKLVGLSSV